MILSVPVIYRFCLTVVFLLYIVLSVAYRLVYGCILTYFVLNVNNSNYYYFVGFILPLLQTVFTTFCQNAKNTPGTLNLPLYKKNVPGISILRLARSRAAIYIFARVRIFSIVNAFYATGNSPTFPVA